MRVLSQAGIFSFAIVCGLMHMWVHFGFVLVPYYRCSCRGEGAVRGNTDGVVSVHPLRVTLEEEVDL